MLKLAQALSRDSSSNDDARKPEVIPPSRREDADTPPQQFSAALFQANGTALKTNMVHATPNESALPTRTSNIAQNAVIEGLEADPEAVLVARLIRALYRVLLLREPDEVGFRTYTSQIHTGRPLEDIVTNFVTSPEFARKRGRFLRELQVHDADNYYHIPLTSFENVDNLLAAPVESFSAVREEIAWDVHRANSIFFQDGPSRKDIATLLRSYVNGVGATVHTFRERAKAEIEKRLNESDGLGPAEIFHDRFHLSRQLLAEYSPSFVKNVFIQASTKNLEINEIFPRSRNELYDPNWLYPFKHGFNCKERPSLQIYETNEADVHVHPSYHVIYHRNGLESWTSGNLQGLGRFVTTAPLFHLNGNVVIVRDFFTGNNFAHFLFDAMTRLGHFCRFVDSFALESTFIFGGLPSEFHELIIDAATRSLGIKRTQCFFPCRELNVRPSGKVYWFSDQQWISRPAQYFHPLSVAILRGLGKCMKLSNLNQSRVYVSRRDAARRGLAYENELTRHLKSRGFIVVSLKEMSIGEQISVMTGAECVVAPHGMGLTYLALHPLSPAVVELFHPTVATAEYGLLAKAYGFPYQSVLGKEVDAATQNFAVNVDEVLEALRVLGIK